MAGVAGVVAVGAVLLAALSSTRLAEQSRVAAEVRAKPPIVHLVPARTPPPAIDAAAPSTAPFAVGSVTAAAETEDPDHLRRRTEAFAALVRTRIPELALIVGHGPGAHDRAVAMRGALRGAGVTVRWCRLKPEAELARPSPDSGLAVYADPKGPDAAPLVAALKAVGFPVVLMAAHRADVGLPSPSIYFAAPGQAPAAEAVQTCNPVLRTGAAAN